jgi:RNA polymerase sigma factor (sigma-70 family)
MTMTAEAATTQAQAQDTTLIQSCLAGDPVAWERLVDKYVRLVLSVARRCDLSDADADDVLQIVFMTLFRHLQGLRDQTRLSSWLITTTYRESWRISKASGKHVELVATVVDDRDPPVEFVAQSERDQIVREAMVELDKRCRDLLSALFLDDDGTSYNEIAHRLGMPVGSIGPTRARCFNKLEGLLRARGLDEEG